MLGAYRGQKRRERYAPAVPSTQSGRKNDDNSITDTIGIAQNEDGIDTEDRIIVLKNYIKANM